MRYTKAALCLIISLALAFTAGCGARGDTPAATDYSGRSIDIIIAVGGFNNYYEPVVERMYQLYPGLNINLSYEKAAAELLVVRELANNMPDIFQMNQSLYSYDDAVRRGICAPLDFVFDLPVMDGEGTLGDIYDMDYLHKGVVDGVPYLIGEIIMTSGLWYADRVLDGAGLGPPATWEELMAAARALGDGGVYALGWCGDMAAEYATQYLFFPMLYAQSPQAFARLDAGDATVFDEPEARAAAMQLQALRDGGYFDAQSLGLMNLKMQSRMVDGLLCFYPSGSWLEGEMASITPPGMRLEAIPVPPPESGGAAGMFVDTMMSAAAASSQNMDLVGEFYRILLSDRRAIEGQVGIHENAMPIKGFYADYGHLMSRAASQLWSYVDSGEAQPFKATGYARPGDFCNAAGSALNRLMAGAMDADEFCRELGQALRG